MDDSRVLTDVRTGLYAGWYFWLRVLDEVNRATRYGLPFALLLLEAELRPGCPARLLDDAVGRVRGAVRASDLAGALGPARAGVLLPHQDVAASQQAMGRILSQLTRRDGAVRWHPRLLRYPGDGAEISNLLTGGWTERAVAMPGRAF